MRANDDASREDTLARMEASRAEIRRILDPPPRDAADAESGMGVGAGFPRSRTMRMLMSGRGAGTVGAVVGGLLLARPALAFRLLRLLPTGAVAKMLLVKGLSTMRSRKPRVTPG